MGREIPSAEVKKHHCRKSAWIIIHNNVYDVTSFLGEHPGGEESLMEFAGKDGTKGFEDAGHSQDAREMLRKYKIGSLPTCEMKKIRSTSSCCSTSKRRVEKKKSWRTFDGSPIRRCPPPPPPASSSKLKWAIVALAGAIVIGFALKKYLS